MGSGGANKGSGSRESWNGGRFVSQAAKGLDDLPSCFERGASERRPALRMLSCPDLPRPRMKF